MIHVKPTSVRTLREPFWHRPVDNKETLEWAEVYLVGNESAIVSHYE